MSHTSKLKKKRKTRPHKPKVESSANRSRVMEPGGDEAGDDSSLTHTGEPATHEQVLSAMLYQERQAHLATMQLNANLEDEIARLRREVADTRIQRLKDRAAAMGRANQTVFHEVGLKDGDQVHRNDDGEWLVIRNEAPMDKDMG